MSTIGKFPKIPDFGLKNMKKYQNLFSTFPRCTSSSIRYSFIPVDVPMSNFFGSMSLKGLIVIFEISKFVGFRQ